MKQSPGTWGTRTQSQNAIPQQSLELWFSARRRLARERERAESYAKDAMGLKW